jgi:hypothetical protein
MAREKHPLQVRTSFQDIRGGKAELSSGFQVLPVHEAGRRELSCRLYLSPGLVTEESRLSSRDGSLLLGSQRPGAARRGHISPAGDAVRWGRPGEGDQQRPFLMQSFLRQEAQRN